MSRVALDRARRELRVGSARVPLTPVEIGLLQVLLAEPGRYYSRRELLAVAWLAPHGSQRSVDAAASRLRRKLAAVGAPTAWLQSAYGHGYRAELPAS